MSRKHIEEIYCDRCGKKHERRAEVYAGNFYTMEIGWFIFNNGSGSRVKPAQSRSWENLDYDLCADCTASFRLWWKKGKPDV